MLPAASIENISGLLIFQIGGKEFCTDLRLISAILKPGEIKIMKQGRNRTVEFSEQEYMLIDFAGFYSINTEKNLESRRIIFLEIYGQKFSFYVDKVMEIISMDKIFIEESVRMDLAPDKEYIAYILSIQGNRFYFPDYDRIAKESRSVGVF